MSRLTTPSAMSRRTPEIGLPGIADARVLPDAEFTEAWESILLPEGMKARLVQDAVAGVQLRRAIRFEDLPLHGLTLLIGPPGVGKTTVARGLADKIARTLPDEWLFVEVDPHGLVSAALGRSQRSVENLFGTVLDEYAAAGPMVVLIDEVETLVTDRSGLSLEANPIDVHRAVDAALVGLDRLARRHQSVLVLATSNFPEIIDPALASRADRVIQVPLPSEAARRQILEATARAVTTAFPGATSLLHPPVLDQAARLTEGMDGRRLRKAVAAACGRRRECATDPSLLTGDDLLAELREPRWAQ